MNRTQHTVLVADLADIVADPKRGMISLVGDRGGIALITGDIEPSHVMRDTIAIETEHGTVHLEPDDEVTISEETPYDPNHEWVAEWSIDSFGSTPAEAAARVWVENFGRTVAGADDACVFTVTDSVTKVAHRVDLSETGLGRFSS